jgi:hypothetical protein
MHPDHGPTVTTFFPDKGIGGLNELAAKIGLPENTGTGHRILLSGEGGTRYNLFDLLNTLIDRLNKATP